MKKYLIILALLITLGGCASKVDYSEPENLAAAISEGCKEHAEAAEKKGRRYFASYAECMNLTLYHLKTRTE